MGRMSREQLRFKLRHISRMIWDTQRGATVINGATRLCDRDIERQMEAAYYALGDAINEYFENCGIYGPPGAKRPSTRLERARKTLIELGKMYNLCGSDDGAKLYERLLMEISEEG